MAEVASAYVSLLPSLQGFGRRMSGQMNPVLDRAGRDGGKRLGDGMTKSFNGATKRLFAGVVTGLATIGVGSLLKDAIAGASDLNEAGTKTQAIFGKAGRAIVDGFAGRGAEALGQTRLDVLNAASTFGTFGKAAGLGGKDLAKFSTGFAGLSTDLASFYNTSPEEAVEAIGSALRGEAEPIRKYGVLLDDATLRQEAMRLGLIKTTTQALTPQQKVLAAQAAIWRQTKDAQGDFQKTSGGLANQQRILQAKFKDLRSELGQKMLPTAVKVVSFINDKFIPAVGKFSGKVKAGFADFKKAFQGGLDFEADTPLERVAVAIRKVSDVVKKAAPFVKAFFGGLLKGDTGYAGPLERFAVAGDKVRGAISGAYEKVKQFGGWLKSDLFPAIREAADEIFPAMKEAWKIITGGTGDGAKGAGDAFRTFGDVLTKVLIPAFSALVRVWLPIVATNIRIVIEAVKLVARAFTLFKNTVDTVVAFIIRRIADAAAGFAVLLDALGNVPGFDWATDAAAKIRGIVQEARNVAREIADLDGMSATIAVNLKPQQGRLTVGTESLNIGLREHGGRVQRGNPYIVGEKRPELFVPNQSGKIIPKVPTGSGDGGPGVVQNFNGNIVAHDYADFERQMDEKRRRSALGVF